MENRFLKPGKTNSVLPSGSGEVVAKHSGELADVLSSMLRYKSDRYLEEVISRK